MFDLEEIKQRILAIEERLDRGDSRMGGIESELANNTSATNEVLEIVQMGKGFFKAAESIGAVIKWTLAIGASIAAIWAAWKSGTNPN